MSTFRTDQATPPADRRLLGTGPNGVFLVAGLASLFAAFAYAEFAGMAPRAGASGRSLFPTATG